MRHPISACLIVKNDHRIERAVASIRDHVDEVCIVDTGSTDGTAEIAERIADRFERFTECNFEDGEIADFSAARTRSFALATHGVVVWLDSDDLVEGAEFLRDAVEWSMREAHGQPWRTLFPYAYDQDADGNCTNWQQRERIVYPKSAFHWVYRVHEGLTAIQANEWKTLEGAPQPIVWRHDLDRSKPRSRRNIRILRDHVKRVGVDNVDPKTQFDLGMEFAKAGDHLLAMGWLARYVNSSDLDEDRMLACLHMVDVLAFWPGREQDATRWAHRATEILPDSPQGHWALAKLAYAAAGKSRDPRAERRHLDRTVHFAREGLALAPRALRVPVNPLDATVNIPWMLQDALERLGDKAGALAAMRVCAAAQPDDPRVQLKLRESELRAAPSKDLDVVIVCGVTVESWDPHTAAVRGIGGSETAVIELGKRLAALGCRVRVYCRVETAGLYDGVEYRSMGESAAAAGCDVLIAWRNATLLETTPAKVKWLWLHDTEAIGPSSWNLSLADRILVLSQWHAEHVAKLYPEHAKKITVTRNGIDLARFGQAVEREEHRAIWSSSPDRGLDEMLDMWPDIRAQVPDAELHVFYGFEGLDKDSKAHYLARLEATEGVVVRGRVDQKTLASEMLAAGAWLYPSWAYGHAFCETSCITAMEAQAAGLHIVASEHGALRETAHCAVIVPGEATSPEYREAFIEASVQALRGDGHPWQRAVAQAHAADAFGWDDVATTWRRMLGNDAAHAAPSVSASRVDERPLLHMILAPQASGGVAIDARAPGGEAMGGGSRAGFLGLVAALARRGEFRIRAFSTFREPLVVRDGVEYVRLDRMVSYDAPDIAFAYYDTSPLQNFGPGTLRIASHHTYAPYMHFDHADVNTAPSRHAVDALRRHYDPTGAWHVLPNGCDAPRIERDPVDGRIIYHTSPDRGLDLLFEAYPIIKAAVPHASLHVVGAVRDYIEAARKGHDRQRPRAERMARALDAAEAAGGVTLLGRLPRASLERELAEASVFAFPCAPEAPCETFSLSIMECCALGLPVVLCPADALESIYAGHVCMVDAPAADHVQDFADAVAQVLRSPVAAAHWSASGKALAEQFTFAHQADALAGIMRTHRAIQQAAAE